MPLLALPDELQLEIVSYLDPYSTLRLSKANTKFFHLLRTPQRIKEILLFLETKPQLYDGKRYMAPCYGCLKICSISAFLPLLWNCALGQVYSEKRRCNTCDAIEGGSFAAEGRSICERGLVQCGTPNYSSESEDETENEIGSASDNESESEDEVGSTEETENAIAMESEDEAEN